MGVGVVSSVHSFPSSGNDIFWMSVVPPLCWPITFGEKPFGEKSNVISDIVAPVQHVPLIAHQLIPSSVPTTSMLPVGDSESTRRPATELSST